MTDLNQQYVKWFRDSSPYINMHRGKTFVIKISGSTLASGALHTIVQDIALLQSLGIKLVVVHGARPQIDERLAASNTREQYHNGTRITDAETLGHVIEICGGLKAQIESQLSMGLANSPMHLSRIRVSGGNMVTARPLGIHDGVDYQHTGVVRKVDTLAIQSQLDNGNVVLISPIGFSPTGEIFNLRSDECATAIANQLTADKLVAYDDTPVRGLDGEPLRQLTLSEANYLYERQEEGAKNPTLEAMINANQGGVERCHVLDHNQDGALIRELFTRDGSGCMIYHDNYETIRSAGILDVGGIIELIEPLERQGVLVVRPRELLEQEISNFIVIERDGMIVACAAIYPFPKDSSAEVACVVAHPEYQNGGRGEKLMAHVEREAKSLGVHQLFVLTTQTAHWFQELGFAEGPINDLPVGKKNLYNFQRGSKVFFKPL